MPRNFQEPQKAGMKVRTAGRRENLQVAGEGPKEASRQKAAVYAASSQ